MATVINRASSSKIAVLAIEVSQVLDNQKEARRLSITTGGGNTKGIDKLKSAIASAEAIKHIDEHRIPIDQLYVRLGLEDPSQGLTKETSSKRLHLEGENILSEKKGTAWYIMFLAQLTNYFALLLWVSAILCVIAYFVQPVDYTNIYTAAVLVGVVLVTACFAYYQEASSAAIMASFKNFVPPMCNVVREGGKKSKVPASQIVRGDVIELIAGDRIPADLRIIFSNEMKVDNSSLTGESEPQPRGIKCTAPDNILETSNVAFFGTNCVEGNGVGVVILVANNTCIGRIATLANEAPSETTPLKREINRFVIIITYISLMFGLCFLISGFAANLGDSNTLVYIIGIVVANVPEGLIATMTVCLALTAKKLSEKYVLVKNLECVETLGSTSCICSDKTGTLTQNKMTVMNLWYDSKLVKADSLEALEGEPPEYDVNSPTFQMLQKGAVLGSKAGWNMALPEKRGLSAKEKLKLTEKQKADLLESRLVAYHKELEKMPRQNWPTTGDASESGLIKFFQPIRDIDEMRKDQPLVEVNGFKAEIPFNSTNKYALQIREPSEANPKQHRGKYLLLLKGAPERVWARCSKYLYNGEEYEISQKITEEYNQANKYFANNGQRVFGFSYLWLPRDQFPNGYEFDTTNINFPMDNLVFVGLAALEDPPRKSVPFAVEKCQAAGIKVIMVTGDQPDTATAIARRVNIITVEKTVNEIAADYEISLEEAMDKSDAIVIHGDLLTKATADDELLPPDQQGKVLEGWLKKKEIVFARTSPAQKLIIVEGCQKLGHMVAVTGDGVNDSPAIKKADIGIAMGVVGSDVAKDAADMILLTDDFSAIVTGVEQGRLIFDNLQKCVSYMLTANIPELVPFLMLVAVGIPVPMTTVLMLFVSVVTCIVPGIAMAYEKAESDIMLKKPRNHKTDRLVKLKLIGYAYLNQGIIDTAGSFYAYYVVFNDYGFKPPTLFNLASTVYGTQPNDTDVYNETDFYKGNTRARALNGSLEDQADWSYDANKKTDLRIWYWTFNDYDWSNCHYDDYSDISNARICWTTEAMRQAQTAYFVATILGQIGNYICIRTQKISIFQHGIDNYMMHVGFFFETALTILLTYCIPLGYAFNTRKIRPLHFAVPAMPFFIIMIVHDELRRLVLRIQCARSNKPGFVERLTYV